MPRGFDYTTTLGFCWSKMERCWNYYYPRKVDGYVLHDFIKTDEFQSLLKELDERGYDTETLRFSIKKKVSNDTGEV